MQRSCPVPNCVGLNSLQLVADRGDDLANFAVEVADAIGTQFLHQIRVFLDVARNREEVDSTFRVLFMHDPQ